MAISSIRHQLCHLCKRAFPTLFRRHRPRCHDCRALPRQLPDWPERCPYAGDPELQWVSRFLTPRLIGEPEPELLKPVRELLCVDCRAVMPGVGSRRRRCASCSAPKPREPRLARAPRPAPAPRPARTCLECGAPLPAPNGRGRPSPRCQNCRGIPQPAVVKEVPAPPLMPPAPIPDYRGLADWLRPIQGFVP